MVTPSPRQLLRSMLMIGLLVLASAAVNPLSREVDDKRPVLQRRRLFWSSLVPRSWRLRYREWKRLSGIKKNLKTYRKKHGSTPIRPGCYAYCEPDDPLSAPISSWPKVKVLSIGTEAKNQKGEPDPRALFIQVSGKRWRNNTDVIRSVAMRYLIIYYPTETEKSEVDALLLQRKLTKRLIKQLEDTNKKELKALKDSFVNKFHSDKMINLADLLPKTLIGCCTYCQKEMYIADRKISSDDWTGESVEVTYKSACQCSSSVIKARVDASEKFPYYSVQWPCDAKTERCGINCYKEHKKYYPKILAREFGIELDDA